MTIINRYDYISEFRRLFGGASVDIRIWDHGKFAIWQHCYSWLSRRMMKEWLDATLEERWAGWTSCLKGSNHLRIQSLERLLVSSKSATLCFQRYITRHLSSDCSKFGIIDMSMPSPFRKYQLLRINLRSAGSLYPKKLIQGDVNLRYKRGVNRWKLPRWTGRRTSQ